MGIAVAMGMLAGMFLMLFVLPVFHSFIARDHRWTAASQRFPSIADELHIV
jgi:multidrug efflux pump